MLIPCVLRCSSSAAIIAIIIHHNNIICFHPSFLHQHPLIVNLYLKYHPTNKAISRLSTSICKPASYIISTTVEIASLSIHWILRVCERGPEHKSLHMRND